MIISYIHVLYRYVLLIGIFLCSMTNLIADEHTNKHGYEVIATVEGRFFDEDTAPQIFEFPIAAHTFVEIELLSINAEAQLHVQFTHDNFTRLFQDDNRIRARTYVMQDDTVELRITAQTYEIGALYWLIVRKHTPIMVLDEQVFHLSNRNTYFENDRIIMWYPLLVAKHDDVLVRVRSLDFDPYIEVQTARGHIALYDDVNNASTDAIARLQNKSDMITGFWVGVSSSDERFGEYNMQVRASEQEFALLDASVQKGLQLYPLSPAAQLSRFALRVSDETASYTRGLGVYDGSSWRYNNTAQLVVYNEEKAPAYAQIVSAYSDTPYTILQDTIDYTLIEPQVQYFERFNQNKQAFYIIKSYPQKGVQFSLASDKQVAISVYEANGAQIMHYNDAYNFTHYSGDTAIPLIVKVAGDSGQEYSIRTSITEPRAASVVPRDDISFEAGLSYPFTFSHGNRGVSLYNNEHTIRFNTGFYALSVTNDLYTPFVAIRYNALSFIPLTKAIPLVLYAPYDGDYSITVHYPFFTRAHTMPQYTVNFKPLVAQQRIRAHGVLDEYDAHTVEYMPYDSYQFDFTSGDMIYVAVDSQQIIANLALYDENMLIHYDAHIRMQENMHILQYTVRNSGKYSIFVSAVDKPWYGKYNIIVHALSDIV